MAFIHLQVDVVLNNLQDQVHPQHVHGNSFRVLGTGYGLRPNLSSSEVLTVPGKGMCHHEDQISDPASDNPMIGDPLAPVSWSTTAVIHHFYCPCIKQNSVDRLFLMHVSALTAGFQKFGINDSCRSLCVQFPYQVWGCPFKNETNFSSLNVVDPYETDTVMVPAHSWAVIRIHFRNPGQIFVVTAVDTDSIKETSSAPPAEI